MQTVKVILRLKVQFFFLVFDLFLKSKRFAYKAILYGLYYTAFFTYRKHKLFVFEPVHEKTNNLGFRPGLSQARLYSHRIKLEA